MTGPVRSFKVNWHYVNEALAFPAIVSCSAMALVTIYALIAIQLGLHQRPEHFLATTVGIGGAAAVPMTILAFYREHKKYAGQLALQRFATTDPLTGVLNRRAFQDAVEDERSRMNRSEHCAAIILFDFDKFKALNDAYGHVVGDQVLIEIAAIAHSELRGPFDRLGRWGGEEFIILLQNVTLEQANGVAERLRQRIEDHAVDHAGHRVATTASFGTSPMISNCAFADALVRADTALYQAKKQGRNTVASCDQFELAA